MPFYPGPGRAVQEINEIYNRLAQIGRQILKVKTDQDQDISKLTNPDSVQIRKGAGGGILSQDSTKASRSSLRDADYPEVMI